jgi:hypothetical protein
MTGVLSRRTQIHVVSYVVNNTLNEWYLQVHEKLTTAFLPPGGGVSTSIASTQNIDQSLL